MAKAMFTGNTYPIHPTFGSIYPDLLVNTPDHRTMLDEHRLRILYELAITSSWLEGDVAEAGVWKGGVVYLLASVLDGKTIHAFDSWEGLPGLTEEDCVDGSERVIGFYEGWGKVSPPYEYLSKFNNVSIHKGWFRDTFIDVSDIKFSLVHVDCDLYQPIKECCEFFIPRLVSGGWIVFDDYLEPDLYPGAVKAVDDYFTAHCVPFEYYRWAGLILRKL